MGSKTEYTRFYGRLKDIFALPVSRRNQTLLYMLAHRQLLARSIIRNSASTLTVRLRPQRCWTTVARLI